MKSVFAEMLCAFEKKKDMVLISVIENAGSTPRGAGALMLADADGRLAGTIGGGAIEKLSLDMARELLQEHRSLLHHFLLRQNEEEDIGMVCGGDMTVLFTYIASEDPIWMAIAGKCMEQLAQHRGGWLVRTLDGQSASLVGEEGSVLAGEPVPAEVLCSGMVCRKEGRYFSMPLPKGERVIIFGAGHIAQALVPLLHSVGFRPVVYDCRPEFAVENLFPQAEQVICADYRHIKQTLDIEREDYIVIMTHGHSHDFEVEEQMLREETMYVGVIGSSRKTAAVNAGLWEAGISKEVTDRVHTPIGTKIKAVTPAEIAVSIAGEMIYVRALEREKKGAEPHFCPMH